jgi:signal peptidase
MDNKFEIINEQNKKETYEILKTFNIDNDNYIVYTDNTLTDQGNLDVIINKTVDKPTDIKVNDIITFESTGVLSYGKTVTHRVQDIYYDESASDYEYVTKGDNNPIKDDTPASYSNLIGKVVLKIPGLGNVQRFVGSKIGWLVVVIIPALVIIIQDIMKIIKVSNVKKRAEIENQKIVSQEEHIQ